MWICDARKMTTGRYEELGVVVEIDPSMKEKE